MKLKNIIKLCTDSPININFDGKLYGCVGHEISSLYNCANSYTSEYKNEKKKELDKVLKQYGKCEIVDIYGFDDGLTITIKVEENK